MHNLKPTKRVVVTGVGAVSPLGNSMTDSWNALIERKNVAAPVSAFDASHFPTQFAFEVSDFKLASQLVSAEEFEIMNNAAQFGCHAGNEAIIAAGLEKDPEQSHRRSVVFGSGMGNPDFEWFSKYFVTEKFDDPILRNQMKYYPNTVGLLLGRILGASGGVSCVHTACASSGQAIGEAFRKIARGDADVVLTGGSDSMVNAYYVAGFNLLGALSKQNEDPSVASRPFDQDRDGFVLGEGACALIFEEYEHAKSRGAKILAEVAGYGVTESAYRITDLHEEGRGPVEAMADAVADAGIDPCEINYINAHGTSTHLNDKVEAQSIAKVFHKDGHQPFVSSSKSLTGHMISAAGAMEAAICIQSIVHQVIPPSHNLFNLAEECPIRACGPKAKKEDISYTLSNSVGFGGSNTAVVFKRGDDA